MKTLTSGQLEKLRSFGTSVIASTIETFHVRLPNVGFTNANIRCLFPEHAPVVGYAATARMKSARPPMEGGSYYYDHADWWKYILTIPEPRVVVIEDMDKPSGMGAYLGEVNAEILTALGCIAFLTNGAARDLPVIRSTGFQVFAGNLSVSHAYAHVFDFGHRVEVAGMEVSPGDLSQGDMDGVLKVPLEIASDISALADEIVKRRHAITTFCHSPNFEIDELRRVMLKTELRHLDAKPEK